MQRGRREGHVPQELRSLRLLTIHHRQKLEEHNIGMGSDSVLYGCLGHHA